jgi:uracil-DNA glycosylase family 4
MTDQYNQLAGLRALWEVCRQCSLGEYRSQTGNPLITGEGALGGIMFIGLGPTKADEDAGRCFVGERGSENKILRDTLQHVGITSHSYLAYCVACRSCAQASNKEGQPLMSRNGQPFIRDCPPTAQQLQACLPRLQSEIYIVDPVLIVALGSEVAGLLLHRSVPQSDCGSLHTLTIPGASHVAVLTDKKKQWLRKVKGAWVSPIAQNKVEYSCLVCLSPGDVARKLEDRRPGNPTDLFVETIGLAKVLYERYLTEVRT